MSLVKLSHYLKKQPAMEGVPELEFLGVDAVVHHEVLDFLALKSENRREVCPANSKSINLDEYELAMLG